MSIDVNVQNDLVIVTESSEDITVNVSNAAGPQGPAGANGVGVPVGGSTGQVLKKASATNYDTYWAVEGGGVPYSGASGNVDLGEYELKAGQVEFDQSPTGTAGIGVMRWNDADGTLDLGLKGGNVTLQIGQEQVQRVVNKSGTNLLESAYQVVKVINAQGQRLAVDLAQGNNDLNSADTLGIVTENISNNQEGFITTSGLVRGINTTGSLQGETWVDGDVLYLSPTTAGAITKVKPTAPNHSVILGYVVYAHANNGKIFVKCENGYESSELHDIYTPTKNNNDGIFWVTANNRYESKSIAQVLGFTPVPTTRTLTINGTAYDLSADRAWTVSASSTPAGSNTQIQYNNSGVFGASAGLTYNDSTGSMTLTKNQSSDTSFAIINQSSRAYLSCQVDNGVFLHAKTPIGYTAYKILSGGDGYLYNSSTGDITLLNDNASGKIKFGAGGTSTAQMTLTSAGRLLLGTTTESTYIFDAVGGGRFTGGYEELTDGQIGLRLQGSATNKNIWLSLKNTNASGKDYIFYSQINGRLSIAQWDGVGGTNIYSADSTFTQITASGTSFLFGRESNLLPGLWIGVAAGSQTLTNATLIKNGSDTILSSNSLVRFYNGTNDTGRIFASTGNWLIQTGGTFTDNGYKLDVNGTLRVGATFTISASNGIPAATTDVLNIASGFTTPDIGRIYVGDGTGWRLHFSKRIASVTTDLVSITDTGDLSISGVLRETITTNRQTASYTLALTDRGKLVEMNVATANNLTVPLNSSIAFPIGSKIDLSQYGAGQTTVVATGGVTIRSAGGALKLRLQYSGASLVKIGTDEWYLFGDITV